MIRAFLIAVALTTPMIPAAQAETGLTIILPDVPTEFPQPKPDVTRDRLAPAGL